MIPRARPNYGFAELFRSFFVSRNSTTNRQALREQLSELLGDYEVILTASGRGALYLYLKAMPQKRVIIPAYTCKAVVEAAALANKEVVFAAHDPGHFNATPEEMTRQADADTIVLATHQFGIPCDIVRTVTLAKERGATVIEDVAAALGTRVAGRLAGTFGDAAFFSFDTTKLVNAPLKAGFLAVRDPSIASQVRGILDRHTEELPALTEARYFLMAFALVLIQGAWRYRLFHTMKFRWRNSFTEDDLSILSSPGPFYRYRMSERQAQIIRPQVARLDEIVSKRRRDYRSFLEALDRLENVQLPPRDEKQEWAPIRFPILVPGRKMKFYDRSCELGMDLAFSFSFIQAPSTFEAAHVIADSILNPPFYLRLDEAELQRSIETIRRIDKEFSNQAP